MKTTYYVKPGMPLSGPTTDVNFLRENYRKPGAELWRVTEEDEGEAAIRRMKALESWDCVIGKFRDCTETLAQFADRLSPPPGRTEVRVDWDTLEEVKEPEVWQSDAGVWIAGISRDEWSCWVRLDCFANCVCALTTRATAAIGPTRETALRNLREMQEARKGAK